MDLVQVKSALTSSSSPSPSIPRLCKLRNLIPNEILHNDQLNKAIELLPKNYNFEIHKTIHVLTKYASKRVALQVPEGLLTFSVLIASILKAFANVQVIILGDVTYGACCIDDATALGLGADYLIHYGHSCLVPIQEMCQGIKMLYVFVEIKVDHQHLLEMIKNNFRGKRIVLMGTIQFLQALGFIKSQITIEADEITINVPQCKPLSPGEVLGCTSPTLPSDTDALIFVADGRFHLEATMIANPHIPAYRYDPFMQRMSLEKYDHDLMLQIRNESIERARSGRSFGLILSMLGRQGTPSILNHIEGKLRERGLQVMKFLIKEIRKDLLMEWEDLVDVWIQVACPRLSIDWAHELSSKPVLNAYEASIMLNETVKTIDTTYEMKYYSKDAPGPWTVNYHKTL